MANLKLMLKVDNIIPLGRVVIPNIVSYQVIVLEHWECQKTKLRTMYRTIVNSGLIFGARHWMATMQTHCEWQVFYMATNVPMKDSTGKTPQSLLIIQSFKVL